MQDSVFIVCGIYIEFINLNRLWFSLHVLLWLRLRIMTAYIMYIIVYLGVSQKLFTFFCDLRSVFGSESDPFMMW